VPPFSQLMSDCSYRCLYLFLCAGSFSSDPYQRNDKHEGMAFSPAGFTPFQCPPRSLLSGLRKQESSRGDLFFAQIDQASSLDAFCSPRRNFPRRLRSILRPIGSSAQLTKQPPIEIDVPHVDLCLSGGFSYSRFRLVIGGSSRQWLCHTAGTSPLIVSLPVVPEILGGQESQQQS